MARLKDLLQGMVRGMQRCLPDSLFGRLALLLISVAIASHVLALSLLFEFKPGAPGPDHPPPAIRDQLPMRCDIAVVSTVIRRSLGESRFVVVTA